MYHGNEGYEHMTEEEHEASYVAGLEKENKELKKKYKKLMYAIKQIEMDECFDEDGSCPAHNDCWECWLAWAKDGGGEK